MLSQFYPRILADIGAIAPPADQTITPTHDATVTGVLVHIGNDILPYFLLLAGILAVFYLVWSGIQYITSSGDQAKTKTARAGIMNAIIGIVLIVAAYTIIKLAVGFGNTASQGVSDAGGTSQFFD